MKWEPLDPPRRFHVGRDGAIELSDCGRVGLEPDEQVTFVTPAGGEYDFVRKSWGFYASPSLNARLPSFGLRPALVRSADTRVFLMICERGHEGDFEAYLQANTLKLLCWLDQEQTYARLARLEGA